MLRLVVLICAVFAGAYAQSTQSCTVNSGNLPLHTIIEGCEAAPCALPQREDLVLHAIFKPPYSLDSMRTLATFYLSIGAISIPVPYDLGEISYTCNYLNNRSCPVNQGEILHYTLRLHIEEIFPQGTSAPVEFRVIDDATHEAIFCVRVPIVITAPLSVA
ncbi:uncharacterized protein LOC128679410 [Plodia interpunctella]|uniref:uncharacterized protein LOC128679410 n=1 Tax=Plodia interpunctella TaxID=58824 RepID=UPI0023681CCF|nr:uncharacterized protein LOC128679410 [Plodia interpunctella]